MPGADHDREVGRQEGDEDDAGLVGRKQQDRHRHHGDCRDGSGQLGQRAEQVGEEPRPAQQDARRDSDDCGKSEPGEDPQQRLRQIEPILVSLESSGQCADDFGDGRHLDFTVSTQIAPYQRIQLWGTEGRIELRNFGVFEVKRRAPRKARNPRTGDKVYVPSKNVVTFKPGKEMEELVRKMNPENLPLLDDDSDADLGVNGPVEPADESRAQSPAKADAAD